MTRRCGDCTLCCKLVPVAALGKGANTRCRYQSSRGCRVYHRPEKGFPRECGMWSCAWLVKPETAGLKRPDRSHYVVDTLPDLVRVTNNATGKVDEVPCLQIWLDPGFPEAWQDPALFDFVDNCGMPALIRQNQIDGFGLFPPSVTGEKRFAVSGPTRSVPTITGSRLLDHLTAETEAAAL
jgi:hypothetical protein